MDNIYLMTGIKHMQYLLKYFRMIYILKKLNLNEQNILQLSGMQSLDERFI